MRKPRRDKWEAGGPRIARYSNYKRNRMVNHCGSHMLYTEAQTLDEAVDLILQKQAKKKRQFKKKAPEALDKEFGYKKPKSITMPKINFLKNGDE